MNEPIRVAFFPDSYLEVNGAAMTSQRLSAYARKNGFPYLVIHANKNPGVEIDGSVRHVGLKRSPASFKLDEDLAYDPLFQRHTRTVLHELLEFKPDVIHITGLNDVSIIGSYLSWKLQIPMVGSWHTNLHEFAASRLEKLFRFLPEKTVKKISKFAEKKIMYGAKQYYRMPKVILAPNQELIDTLGRFTKRSARLMSRGVDVDKFTPEQRTVNDNVFRLGFVGRLREEKNVRLLVSLEKELLKAGKDNFEFLIVGEGTEREFLEKNMKHATVTGFLDGAELSSAYANMDIFIFPSETDAFGNVAQEANASGVPAIVTDKGGPKFIIREGETGFVAKDLADFTRYTIQLMDDREKLTRMKASSREFAMSRSWDSVFESVYSAYHEAVELAEAGKVKKKEGLA